MGKVRWSARQVEECRDQSDDHNRRDRGGDPSGDLGHDHDQRDSGAEKQRDGRGGHDALLTADQAESSTVDPVPFDSPNRSGTCWSTMVTAIPR